MTDDVSRCQRCGHRLIPTMSPNGRTALSCMWCDGTDPMQTELAKWADSPLAETESVRHRS
jgi:hypothetical protein